ncbi:MAG: DNA repair protein RecO [Flavobacteriaceae bacterium]|nr:MAG: DNA repair protein RecO [Flavobacteriaceae bacterium]
MNTQKGYLLKTTPYGDTSLIFHCFVRSQGLKSYLLKGARKLKKQNAGYFYPLVELEFEYYQKKNQDLALCKSVQIAGIHRQIYTSPQKSSVVMFVCEILIQFLRKENLEEELYDFIDFFLLDLAQKESGFSDHHLYFLLQLAELAGFGINQDQIDSPYFDTQQGLFVLQKSTFTLEENTSNLLKKILLNPFGTPIYNKVERNLILEAFFGYFTHHFNGFKEPVSWIVLKQIFS